MGRWWPYSWCFVVCCLQDLFSIARSILMYLPSTFFSSCLVSVQLVHPYSSIDTLAAWKKFCFILSARSDFHMTDSLLIAVHVFVSHESMSFSLMRHCFLGRWNCVQVSESYRLVWKCRLFDYSTYIPFCVHWHEGHVSLGRGHYNKYSKVGPDYVKNKRKRLN